MVEQLSAMSSALPDTLTVDILVASIEVNALMLETACIMTPADKDSSWKEVASRLMEEATELGHDFQSAERFSAAHECCGI